MILIINAITITITAFARIRHLRKRSTYLIINLTVADLLVGTITGTLFFYSKKETTKGEGNNDFEWRRALSFYFQITFPIASQVNLRLICLDRLHATLFPFRHCLISKWFYFKVIISTWFIAFILASLVAGLFLINSDGGSYPWASFSILTILFLAVSYVIVILNVLKSPHSQNHGLIHTERKLSLTLFIVTGVSVLTILPWAIYTLVRIDIKRELSCDLHVVIIAIYISSSIVNPLVYTVRMQEFRNAFRKPCL